MKNIMLILFTLVLVINVSAKNELTISSFEKANQSYQQGNYEKAILSYQQILHNGLESSELYYNLGNAFYKSHKIPKAILNYERGLVLDPFNRNLIDNLSLANEHIVDRVEASHSNFFNVNFFLGMMSPNIWAWISLISFLLILSGIGIFLFTTNTSLKRISFWSFILLIIISASSFFFSRQQAVFLTNNKKAIIMNEIVDVKSAPNEQEENLFYLHEGAKIEVVDTLKNWSKIKYGDHDYGWIKKNDFEKV